MRTYKMRYPNEPRNQSYDKDYGFLFFVKKMGENLSSKYGQKTLATTKNSVTECSKIQHRQLVIKILIKRAEINTSAASQKISGKSKASTTPALKDETLMEIPRENYIPPEKRQQVVDELR